MKRLFPALLTLALVSFFGSAAASKIEPGFDLLKTKKGELTLKSLKGKAISPLNMKLKSNPIKKKKTGKKFGKTDKVLQRKKLHPRKADTIDVELVHLSLKSAAPVKIKKKNKTKKYDAFVTLNKKENSKGQLKIKSHDDKKGGGDFLLTLNNLFLKIDFVPILGGQGGAITELIDVGPLRSSGGTWSHGADSSYPTIPNFPAGNFFIRDFGLGNDADPFFLQSIVAARVPLPATLLLIGSGLLFIGFARTRGPMT
ncbi:MAG: hypothetical protein CMI14_11675 [Oleispira sp.]|nr:hypothetical protein [Oleispira sp.]|tara:strand:+ start:1244 stop:2011 length:768 start_codon:yes stop_codon:yes gene_type:complete